MNGTLSLFIYHLFIFITMHNTSCIAHTVRVSHFENSYLFPINSVLRLIFLVLPALNVYGENYYLCDPTVFQL